MNWSDPDHRYTDHRSQITTKKPATLPTVGARGLSALQSDPSALQICLAKTLPPVNLTDGEPLHGELFPLVWKRAG